MRGFYVSDKVQCISFAICGTCWVENKKVADRAILVRSHIVEIVRFWQKLAPSKQPKCKSYTTLKEAASDKVVIPKLQFFTYVASVLEPFLQLYQTDAPMTPFMYFDIKNLVTNQSFFYKLIFVKLEVIKGCNTASDLLEIDLSMEKNLFKVNQISVGFATEIFLPDLMKKDLVGMKKVKQL